MLTNYEKEKANKCIALVFKNENNGIEMKLLLNLVFKCFENHSLAFLQSLSEQDARFPTGI